MKNIGICVITYNRLCSLRRVMGSLQKAYYNRKVDLIISIDKSKSDNVQKYAESVEWSFGEKKLIVHPQNLGLRRHVLSCGDLLKDYDAMVILEDDITVAPSFFYYTEQCVEKYADNDDIAGISLYRFAFNYQTQLPLIALQSDSDVYLQQSAMSWGQVWMKRQWFEFKKWYDQHCEEFGELPHLPRSICRWPETSWLKYHMRYCIEHNKYFVYPYVSLATNNGDAGTHTARSSTGAQTPVLYGKKEKFNLNPTIKYDGFFESELLYDALGLTSNELCVDFYGEKMNRENKRYWLSREILPFHIVKSFAVALKPYEMNILNPTEGTELFLYDTTKREKNRYRLDKERHYIYFFGVYMNKNRMFRLLYSKAKRKFRKAMMTLKGCSTN